MLTLGIDTTGTDCSAAILNNGKVAASLRQNAPRRQVECLMDILEGVLSEAGVTYGDLERIGVTVGPGSFTGIRIGLATANGIALASPADVVGIGSLHAIAHEALELGKLEPAVLLVAALDAGRQALYLQAFGAGLAVLTPPACVPLSETSNWLREVSSDLSIRPCGPGSGLLVESLQGGGAQVTEGAVPAPERGIDPVSVGRLAAVQVLETDRAKPEPLYIRSPDAKLPAAL